MREESHFGGASLSLDQRWASTRHSHLVKSLSKSQLPFSAEMEKLVLKFVWKFKSLRIAKTILTMKSKGAGSHF